MFVFLIYYYKLHHLLFVFFPKGRSDGHDHSNPPSEKTGQLQKSGTVDGANIGVRDTLALKDYIMKKSVADLTAEQLQHILDIVETNCYRGPSETHKSRGKSCNSISQRKGKFEWI